ncbi:MAG: hypothetical protein FJ313_07060 [Gemmatimonadetes bacterium]|nr:hypothetical protein [Gemmatimonadota bacterium]
MGRDPAVYNRRADTASPARHVAGSYPPSIIFSGERDRLHPQSVEFDRALTAAGVEHRTLFFDRTMHPEAIHGFLNFFFLGCAGIAMEAAVRFMDEMSAREDHAGGARGYTS